MEDSVILELYRERDERAIAETERKYGAYCRAIAQRILTDPEDAEECVSDALYRAWDAIPPANPERLKLWLGRVTRNIALNRWNHSHAEKRDRGMEVLLDELEDCVPDAAGTEEQIESRELGRILSAWLRTLRPEDRTLFVRRYWYGESVNDLAEECGLPPGRAAQRLYRLRKKLRRELETEGVLL